ncbi:hypothetical protein B0I27_101297 [Arcticibacter pallidicorallinus]|uniref:Uncharacterized protein n=1 Tax=Arcticibacter pallidicorallinus TaxID=1259464 RepID=A0A2T0UBS7_9SPHI|nr:hypothetical protein [Arcticibacter pallidicorallinus]PRY55328.1 hypothetical protein B0I27_101297 [Arcticibacter pallidicorallinus]
MENSLEEKHRDKNGWAIDADPKNDPTYPMKKRSNEEHKGYTWERPTQQFVDVEVLHSNERPNITAVFGTSTPPSGLSGMIRRKAFEYSENHYGHWLPLILADRINVVEGIVDDLKRGHIPNIFAERGWNAEWKYNRKAALTKIAVGLALTAVLVLKISKKSK